MRHSTRYSSEQGKKGTKAINRERKRDSSRSDAIKTLILNQPTTDLTVVLKTGYRQTDRQTDKILIYRLTDSILSV
jgi:mRNA-degrading endonuclease YafQ of YafQ-DinJ toxin-antitoxin module